MAGHYLADLAQLFRYEEQFSKLNKKVLLQAYSGGTGLPLPDNWECMGKLRDLANLLQMIGVENDLPNKFADLRRLIAGTLHDWHD